MQIGFRVKLGEAMEEQPLEFSFCKCRIERAHLASVICLAISLFLICVGCSAYVKEEPHQKDDVATCLAEARADFASRDGFSQPNEIFEWCMSARGYSPDYITNRWDSLKREFEW